MNVYHGCSLKYCWPFWKPQTIFISNSVRLWQAVPAMRKGKWFYIYIFSKEKQILLMWHSYCMLNITKVHFDLIDTITDCIFNLFKCSGNSNSFKPYTDRTIWLFNLVYIYDSKFLNEFILIGWSKPLRAWRLPARSFRTLQSWSLHLFWNNGFFVVFHWMPVYLDEFSIIWPGLFYFIAYHISYCWYLYQSYKSLSQMSQHIPCLNLSVIVKVRLFQTRFIKPERSIFNKGKSTFYLSSITEYLLINSHVLKP